MSFDFAHSCCFLTGPTASGKSDAAVEWAQLHNAEIISMDSAALYRRMDIGTAKPSAQQRQAVPHHLLDIINPQDDFSVADYYQAAQRCVTDILSRGKMPLFVGGTPLYLKALLRGLFDGPAADWSIRNKLQTILNADRIPADSSDGSPVPASLSGCQRLHAMLEQIDPVSAARLHVNDTRRVIRAIEVFELTGKPISAWQQEHDKPIPQDECRVYALEIDREVLHDRIERRVDWMLDNGLIEEVKRLLEFDAPLSRTASQAVGYRETIEFLQNRPSASPSGISPSDVADLRESIIVHTRQLAKRQMTWFRGLSECRLISHFD